MSDSASSPLLGSDAGPSSSPTSRPSSKASRKSLRSQHSVETTPLLSRVDSARRYDGEEDDDDDHIDSPAASSLRLIQDNHPSKTSSSGRWASAIAIIILSVLLLLIIAGGFFAPAIVEEYAKEALVIEPTNLSIDSFTSTGIRARIQADFRLDASRVQKDSVRKLGRAGTWIAHKVESEQTQLQVYLPEYGNILVGSATVPGVVVSIRDGETTHINFVADLEPGDVDGLRNIANDWLQGRLDSLLIRGKVDVPLKSGIFPLGTQTISESLVFEGDKLPSIPAYNISEKSFGEIQFPSGDTGVVANVSLSVANRYPVKLEIPPLGFDILVSNCDKDQPYIKVAKAETHPILIEPNADVDVDVVGVVRDLPPPLTEVCPNSRSSPLDLLLSDYIHGDDTTIFVRGAAAPSGDTPQWVTDLISSVTVPVPFPGHTFDDAIKNFTLRDVHFGLPDPFADPDTPESNPRVSGVIQVIAGIPNELQFGVNITHVRANADVFYQGDKLGVLNLQEWQPANSTKMPASEDETARLKIEAVIKDAVLEVTDDDVFTAVVQALLFGGEPIMLKVTALVDAEIETVLGQLVAKELPAEGLIPVKAPSNGGLGSINPKIGNLSIIDTTPSSIKLQLSLNVTNPTEYTATVPYVNLHILSNGSTVGAAYVENIKVIAGNNTNILVTAIWDPKQFGGDEGRRVGRDLISQYISGWNTTLTIKTHRGTIPSQPGLGEALSKFAIDLPAPKLSVPSGRDGDDDDDGGEDDEGPHFIKGAIFHLLSSSAVFTLLSPLREATLFIDSVNATAIYNHTEPIGHIIYDLPFAVPASELTNTPRLPVDWSPGSVGYDAVKKALGGTLKLGATATVDVRLGRWTENIWFVGGGIGATVRL